MAAAVVVRLRFAVEKCPCKGSPWFLTGRVFLVTADCDPCQLLQRPGASRPI